MCGGKYIHSQSELGANEHSHETTGQWHPNMFVLAVVRYMLNFRNVLYETSCGFCDIVVLAVGCLLNFRNVLWDIIWFLQHRHPGYTLWDLYASYGFGHMFIWKCKISGCTLRGENCELWNETFFFFRTEWKRRYYQELWHCISSTWQKTLWSPRAKWLQLNSLSTRAKPLPRAILLWQWCSADQNPLCRSLFCRSI